VFIIENLNRCIIPEVHPVPTYTLIADTLSYPKPKIYSSLDLRASFHNLKIKESLIKYTAFQTHIGQFEYLRCPFGIQNIPSALCRLMSLIFSKNEGPLIKFALAYLNDVLIFSPCIDSHFEHLREIFVRLRKSKVKINPSKCSFLVHKLIFLGNHITPQGIGPDSDKVSAMLLYPAPTDQKKLRCVLELFQFYKKFIPRHSHMLQTLNRLLGKDVDYK